MPNPSDPAEELEALWRAGGRPDLGTFLAAAGPLPPKQLAEVAGIDRRERWRAGDRVPAEAYFERFPELRADPDLALDLVYGEVLLNEEHGGQADGAGVAVRFPDLTGSLRIQLELHQALTPPRSADPSDPLPRQFGRYEIDKPLGRGGMGTVYLARDTQLDRRVALKVSNLADDQVRAKQFIREARAAAALLHPNICPVYDFGEVAGRHFITMAYFDGGTLAARIGRGPMPVPEAVGLVRTLAEALAEAHRAGIVHRDLKPANILFDRAGQPVVSDFGLARQVSPTGTESLTSGAIVGTPAYMSPEQVYGDTRAIGPATDVYALGVVLYEVLTGRRPFDGPVYSVLARIGTEDPEDPSRLRPEIDPGLSAVCAKALAKKPADRFPTMTAFAEALGDWNGVSRSTAMTAGGLRRPARPPWVVPVAAVVLLGVVALLVWRPWRGAPPDTQPDAGQPQPVPEVVRDPAAARAASDRAWVLNDADKMDEAIAECAAALRLDDRCVPALLCRANAFIKKREFQPAIADLTRAADIEPKNHMPHVDLAWAYNEMGAPDKALTHADLAVRLNGESEEAYYQRGAARYALKAYPEAVADLTEAIRIKELPWIYDQRAAAYEALGETAKARSDRAKAEELEKARAKHP